MERVKAWASGPEITVNCPGLGRCGRTPRDQIANIHWITGKAREFQKNIYFCFIDYTKAFDCVDHSKLCKVLQEIGISNHLTCILGNLYAGQEATIRTRAGTIDWFQTSKGLCQGCILSPCLFNFYAEYIMRNAGLEEAQCLSLVLEWKLTFSSPVATAEFSKFGGILSAALSQHHLSGFEIALLEFHHLY